MKSKTTARVYQVNVALPIALLTFIVLITAQAPASAQGSPLVSLTNTVWRYHDTTTSATAPGPGWRQPDYDDSSWSSGRALFGNDNPGVYDSPDQPFRGGINGFATPLNLSDGRMTFYFRTHFDFPFVPGGFNLALTAYLDDGAVFYLNGTEIGRVRMPDGEIAWSTAAATAPVEGVPVTLSLCDTALRAGDNVLAVEMHQSGPSSGDAAFALSLHSLVTLAPVILQQPENQVAREGEPVTLFIVGTPAPSVRYQWFFAPANSGSFAPLAGETNSTYSISSLAGAHTGSYYCTMQSCQSNVDSGAATVSILRALPNLSLAIVSPTNGATLATPINLPTSLPVTARLTGEPAHHRWVEFSANATPLGIIGGTTDFTLNWTNVTVGEHTLQAASLELIQDTLFTFVSEPVRVFVADGGLALIRPGAVWKYHDDGTALPPDWLATDYSDLAWLSGEGQFGYGDGDERTSLRYSVSQDTNFITSYFRHAFPVQNPGAYSNLQVRLLRDDGAVVYLNGVELFRDNLPQGPIDRFTRAVRGVGFPEEATFFPTWVNPARLRAGQNVLAVELHQIIPFAGDASFDLALIANTPASPPRLTISRTATDLLLSWPAAFPGYRLQSASTLAASPAVTIWTNVPVPVTTAGNEFRATVGRTGGDGFFRLAVE